MYNKNDKDRIKDLMIILINAGGSGTRLWPLSTKDLPKQFLNLVNNKSLLQSVFERAKLVTSVDKIYVSTSQTCTDIVLKQLPEISKEQVIAEPCRKDTMGSILNATQYIASRHSPNEAIASISSDQYVDDANSLATDLKRAGELSEANQRIVLLGMVPDKPGPKFGHIHKAYKFKKLDNVFEVSGFKEKPDFELAKQYQESGEYLWNSACFIAPYSVFKEKTEQNADQHWSQQLKKLEGCKTTDERNKIYEEFEREALDIALMERTSDLLVIPQTFSWKDLGSFDDIYDINKKDQDGSVINSSNEVISLESSKNYVHSNGENKPISIVGLDNIIVVDTADGLLIAHMNQAQLVKKISDILEQ
jgi:mannose-1-phosphate guanylyltransferase/mannose-6-phosphate isomerase